MIDIYSEGGYPACELSNFAEHPFVLDGVQISSMEGFLQSLKYMTVKKQEQVCRLSGKEAKQAGKGRFMWCVLRFVWWQEQTMDLMSDEVQLLIDRAYDAMYEQNPKFRQALLDTGDEKLEHTLGKTRMDQTILTRYNFVRRLERLRARAEKEVATLYPQG